MSIWVVNTSPLVFLGNLGRLELLRQEGREVYSPQAVAEEVTAKLDPAAEAVRIAWATWMHVQDDVIEYTLAAFGRPTVGMPLIPGRNWKHGAERAFRRLLRPPVRGAGICPAGPGRALCDAPGALAVWTGADRGTAGDFTHQSAPHPARLSGNI